MHIPADMIVAECTLAKNLLVSVGGYSPYQALFGRLPPIMSEFEPASDTQLDDIGPGVPGVSKHHHRLREIAAQSMVDGGMQGLSAACQEKAWFCEIDLAEADRALY